LGRKITEYVLDGIPADTELTAFTLLVWCPFFICPGCSLAKGEIDMKPTKRKLREKAQEYSERFWREIMGQNKQILKRGKGGAYKRK